MGMKIYNKKRNFKITPKPAEKVLKKKTKNLPSFIVQKHAARNLHYDFRLEMAGVLKSWALPKGFPVAKGDKRLAIHVEDHPMEYAHFEGVIPEGQYGGGTVMVWEVGYYQVLNASPLSALKSGKIEMILAGTKLKGHWTLVRTKNKSGDKEAWLLLKSHDDVKPLSASQENKSALTKRTMKQIAEARDAVWQSDHSHS